MKQIHLTPRNFGNTQRMLETAKVAALQGKKVLFIVPTKEEVERLGREINCPSVQFKTTAEIVESRGSIDTFGLTTKEEKWHS